MEYPAHSCIRLQLTAEQDAILSATLSASRECFNAVAALGWERQEKNGVTLHQATYTNLNLVRRKGEGPPVSMEEGSRLMLQSIVATSQETALRINQELDSRALKWARTSLDMCVISAIFSTGKAAADLGVGVETVQRWIGKDASNPNVHLHWADTPAEEVVCEGGFKCAHI